MSDWVEITVRWPQGAVCTFRVAQQGFVVPWPEAQVPPRAGGIRTRTPKEHVTDYASRSPELVAEAKRLRADGLRQVDIAERLNAAGFTTLRGKPITQATVSDLLRC